MHNIKGNVNKLKVAVTIREMIMQRHLIGTHEMRSLPENGVRRTAPFINLWIGGFPVTNGDK